MANSGSTVMLWVAMLVAFVVVENAVCFHLDIDFHGDHGDAGESSKARQCEHVSLQPCYMAVERPDMDPSRECCSRLERIPDECMCEVLSSDRRLGQQRYRYMAMELPEKCELPMPQGRECESPRSISLSSNSFSVRKCEQMMLQPCYSAVESSDMRQPSEACCRELRQIPDECMCETLMNESRMGKSREYRSRALRLPEMCDLPRPRGRECRGVLTI
ncbi:hypothetical protein O6H91_12G032100 [Diphasiastrum complanatum]|uniref:Uncharacterized protein n=1 Tax=Diphasiastrum complanatum TaxID=34168 RepID=A0ACC2C057_DIPCM|nr:hypothetical protein O6H91_12G032100 [Diphasiastrum complanatum]